MKEKTMTQMFVAQAMPDTPIICTSTSASKRFTQELIQI
jgi:hypothetical protein